MGAWCVIGPGSCNQTTDVIRLRLQDGSESESSEEIEDEPPKRLDKGKGKEVLLEVVPEPYLITVSACLVILSAI